MKVALSAVRGFLTSSLAVAAYAAIFIAVLVTDDLANVPKNQRGFDLDEAYTDLQRITTRPHPYNSFANDAVHSYLHSRLENITRGHSFAHLVDDSVSNVSTHSATGSLYGVYFEGTNLLVKIDGTEVDSEESGAVLFSAHYDSVSTAPGATDDGMGVVTLLQMAQYLVKNRPRRTAIFNINNGEEDWLNGAQAFLKHPWSNLTDIFINLEGAASGGRPTLFRATSIPPANSFSKFRVTHPHGNVLSSDAFSRGLIRSGTDYSVYTERSGKPMQGLDFAFYKGRSWYHTKFDAVPFTIGGKKALWSMIDTCRGSGLALLNEDWDATVTSGRAGSPVYFDLFGRFFVVFSLNTLFAINIVLLVVGPLLLLLIYALDIIRAQKSAPQNRLQIPVHPSTSWATRVRPTLKGLLRWSQFWLALIVTIGFQVLLVFGYSQVNPYAIYSSPYLFVVTSLTLAFLTFASVRSLPFASQQDRQSNNILSQLYVLTWAMLVFSTITGLGGTYWITAFNTVVWLGLVVGLIEEGSFMVSDASKKSTAGIDNVPEESALLNPSEGSSESVSPAAMAASSGYNVTEEREDDEHATERTPLVRKPSATKTGSPEEKSSIFWWIVQFILVVPVPVVLISHIIIIITGALPQTLADGSSAVTVYSSTAALCVLLVLPLAPFTYKLHRFVSYTLLLIFIFATLYAYLLVSPFDASSPLKVYFQQTVEVRPTITNSSSTEVRSIHGNVIAKTTLTALMPYVKDSIIPFIPSARDKNVSCITRTDDRLVGLKDCSWDTTELLPDPAHGNIVDLLDHKGENAWFQASITHFSDEVAMRKANLTRFTIWPSGGTRNCRVYFDGGKKVRAWRVLGSGDGWVVPQRDGKLGEVRLWRRTWDEPEFILDVEWDDSGAEAEGRLACEYAQYESGMIGLPGIQVGGRGTPRILAFEEVLGSLPAWAVPTKMTDGLVEVWQRYRV